TSNLNASARTCRLRMWLWTTAPSSGMTAAAARHFNRPGLDRLRDAVRAGEVGRVLVTDPDRLSRNYVQMMVLLQELERFGCQVVFLDRPMGRDPQDQLLLQIRGAVA